MPDRDATTCPNCGAARHGGFCTSCGQDNRRDRLDATAMLGAAFESLVELEVPIFRTVAALSTRPGAMIRAYVEGRRRRYTNPVKYCFITLTAVVLVLLVAGISVTESVVRMVGGTPDPAMVGHGAIVEQSLTYVGLIVMPFIAVWLWLTSLRRFNYTENLVFALYAFGQFFLLGTVLAVIGSYRHLWLFIVQEVAGIAYLAWAAKGFYGGSVLAAAGRGLLAYLMYTLGTTAFGALLIFAVQLYRMAQ